MRTIVFGIAVMIGMGCASAPADRNNKSEYKREGEDIVIAEGEDRVSDCSFLTEVKVEPPYAMLSKAYPEMDFATRYEMRLQLRRKTSRAGGDTVLPTALENGELHGKTYDCPDEG